MSDGIEAGADIVTGGMIARATEPAHGESHGGIGRCLNCDTALIGSHCHACGQSAHVHRTFGAIWHDILHGVFHFEGKAWRTLPMLIRRPGELTRRYAAGERARFVSPMALFLFSVFLMFAIVANLPGWTVGDTNLWKPGVAAGMADARTKLAEAKAAADSDIVASEAKLAREHGKSQPDAARIAKLEQRISKSKAQRDDAAKAEHLLPTRTTFNVEGAPAPTHDNWLEKKFRHASENPELVLYKLKTSAYKFSWALIPLSLPFVWLLFPFRSRTGLYDHAVFTTYSLTFMSLLTIALAMLGALGVPGPALFFAAVLIPPFHIYRQLKGAYSLGRGSAIARTIALVTMIVCAIVPLFALLLAYLGVAD